jgi:ribosomal protein S18 acetylase RimI-like enzyme
MVSGRTLFIDDLCVDETVRGQHIGEALFRFAADQARRMGCRDVILNVWEGNDAAKRFYEKMGMTKVDEGDFPIGSGYYMNDYIMGMEI